MKGSRLFNKLRPSALLVVALAAILLTQPVDPASAAPPQPPYDWYRYQGASDSGPKASINCEVTSVAMSIQYARNNLQAPIASIREYMGKEDLTSSADAMRALDHWGVPYRDVNSVQDIIDALGRGHIVMVGLIMGRISLGADYQRDASPAALRFGRYYSFDEAHSVVVKGVTEDRGWFIVYDPNVWDGNASYWYSDGTPKGKDRYYPVGEFARGMADLGDSPKGLEIMSSPSRESQSQPQLPPQGAVSPVLEYPRQLGDLASIVSSSSSWKSTTFNFRMFNPRGQQFPVAQVGVQGRDPAGREFFADSNPITLPASGDGFVAIPMATGEAGVWRVVRVLYYAEGSWRELPAAGFRQQTEFVVR